MRSLRFAFNRVVLVSSIVLLGSLAGCSKPGDKPATATPTISSSVSAQAGSKLGDLSEFRSIAAQVSTLVEHNDLPAAKTRIKDLETSWDSAEAGIKPRAASDWHVLDKAIDRALDALRASSPQQGACKAAMDDLLKTFDSMQAPR
ncbi:hypothetical protein H7A76_15315 [Pseudomonas sp. MSSRFD41]|uniref:hypothetical protein n=1 Tax=Pseudomonas sp. MSSRFD41 TaxID=1310370 RepID=UPI001639F547|nr:hypothetical protein [Pseudomonas sp. MSSRFD41]MBC2656808.1 hypothetical protein [Pseudomonas sp. MSSRFD41]